jgi:hypothetical protein
MIIRPFGAEFFHVDEQRDMTQLYALRSLRTRVKITVACVCVAVQNGLIEFGEMLYG